MSHIGGNRNGDGNGPLVPRPVVTLVVLVFTALLVANVFLGALLPDYDGVQTTFVLAAFLAAAFGFQLFGSRRGGDGP